MKKRYIAAIGLVVIFTFFAIMAACCSEKDVTAKTQLESLIKDRFENSAAFKYYMDNYMYTARVITDKVTGKKYLAIHEYGVIPLN